MIPRYLNCDMVKAAVPIDLTQWRELLEGDSVHTFAVLLEDSDGSAVALALMSEQVFDACCQAELYGYDYGRQLSLFTMTVEAMRNSYKYSNTHGPNSDNIEATLEQIFNSEL